MQVDDKLAKEKLARVIDAVAEEYIVGYMKGTIEKCAQLIRTTDLTDCQQQGYFETNCAGPKCVATTTGCQRGHCQLKNFKNGQMTIAPAPDQGSVRNATDRPYASFGGILAMRVLQSDLYLQLDDAERAECDELVAMWNDILKRTAIRALPDQKD